MKLNSPSLLEDDLNTARSAICTINPQFPICTRNKAVFWEKVAYSDDFVHQFCHTTPGACNVDRLWNADSCNDDITEWYDFFLRPTTKFQLMERFKKSLGPLLGSDMDEYQWNEEVFYVIELAIPDIVGKFNSKKASIVCDFMYPKDLE